MGLVSEGQAALPTADRRGTGAIPSSWEPLRGWGLFLALGLLLAIVMFAAAALTDTWYAYRWVAWPVPVIRGLEVLLHEADQPGVFDSRLTWCRLGPEVACTAASGLGLLMVLVLAPSGVAKAFCELCSSGGLRRMGSLFLRAVAFGWVFGVARMQFVSSGSSALAEGIQPTLYGMSSSDWFLLVVPHTAFYVVTLWARYLPEFGRRWRRHSVKSE